MEPTEEERQRLAYWRGGVDQKAKEDTERDKAQVQTNENIDNRLNSLDRKMTGIETKIKIYSTMGGAVGSIIVAIIVQFIGSK